MTDQASGAEWARRRQQRRRVGLVLILAAIVFVLAGQLLLDRYLEGLLFILYWTACALFTVLALFTALVDMILVRREAARERRRLFVEIMSGRGERKDPPPGPP